MAVTESTTSGTSAQGSSESGNKVMSKVRESAAAQLSTQKNKATEGLGSVAQAVRQSTQQLRDQNHETLAGYVESAADQIERLSRRVRDKNVGELVEDAQRLARRQPAVFIGSAFVLGLVGVRFLKSSAADERGGAREHQRYSPYGRSGYRGGTATPYPRRPQAQATSYTGGAALADETSRGGSRAGGYAAGASGTDVVSDAERGAASSAAESSEKKSSGRGSRSKEKS